MLKGNISLARKTEKTPV